MRKIIPSLVMITFLLIIMVSSPLVMGQVQIEKIAELKPDQRYDFDKVLNHANETDGNYSNADLFWEPFKEDNNLSGITSTTPSPPHRVKLNSSGISSPADHTWVHAAIPLRFTYQQIMSGSSEHYWRMPFCNNSDDYKAKMEIYRVKSKETANISVDLSDEEEVEPEPLSNPIKEFDTGVIDVTENESHDYIEHSVNLNETFEENVSYNFTYIKANAPIYPSEDYYVVYSYKAETEDFPGLYVSRDDVGGNDFFRSHIIFTDGNYADKNTYNVDLDTGVLFLSGISGHMSGMEANGDFNSSEVNKTYLEWHRKFDGSQMTSGDYVTFSLPFRHEANKDVTFKLEINFLNQSGGQEYEWSWIDFAKRRYLIFDVPKSNLDHMENITHVRCNLSVSDVEPEDVNYWVYDYNNNFTKDYKYSSMTVKSKIENGSNVSWEYQEFGFQVFHSLQITNGSWDLVNPIDYYEFREISIAEENTINWVSVAEHVGLWATPGGAAVSLYMWSQYGDKPPHEILWNWGKEGSRMIIDRGMNFIVNSDLFQTLQSWGLKFWDIVKKTVKAIQYYGAGLLNLFIMGFSIASYILYTVVIFKVTLGLIILVTRGSGDMMEYYSSMMDDVIGFSQKAMDMLPVV